MNAETFNKLIDDMSNKPTARAAKKSVKRRSITATAKEQLLKGRSNAQVWSTLKLVHRLPESKRWYVGWNRALLVRQGLLNQTAEG